MTILRMYMQVENTWSICYNGALILTSHNVGHLYIQLSYTFLTGLLHMTILVINMLKQNILNIAILYWIASHARTSISV